MAWRMIQSCLARRTGRTGVSGSRPFNRNPAGEITGGVRVFPGVDMVAFPPREKDGEQD